MDVMPSYSLRLCGFAGKTLQNKKVMPLAGAGITLNWRV
jgi:hypothetical protein